MAGEIDIIKIVQPVTEQILKGKQMWEDNKPEYLQYIIYNHQVSKKYMWLAKKQESLTYIQQEKKT